MATTRAALTTSDITSLMRGATPDERAVAAHKICRRIEDGVLTAEEREIAREILRVLAADAAELVRRSLSVTLRASAILPPRRGAEAGP